MSQNLARQRASKFGQVDNIDSGDPTSKAQHQIYTLATQSESVVVSAAPQHVEFDTDSWKDSSEEVLSTQRRGYFADQFEVREFNYTYTFG